MDMNIQMKIWWWVIEKTVSEREREKTDDNMVVMNRERKE